MGANEGKLSRRERVRLDRRDMGWLWWLGRLAVATSLLAAPMELRLELLIASDMFRLERLVWRLLRLPRRLCPPLLLSCNQGAAISGPPSASD